jgi:F-type H+-transporting ATPase subunit gamma
VKIITVGKKGYDILRRDFGALIIDRVDLREVKNVGFAQADQIARKVIALFNEGQFDVCTLFYSQFRSVISQIPTALQIVPAASAEASGAEAETGGAVYEYEPEANVILGDLIPRNLAVQIFRALLENAAGEMGAKMTAMDNATRNAGDMINRLSITYNRQRQAQITKELIEIISGAEAL